MHNKQIRISMYAVTSVVMQTRGFISPHKEQTYNLLR